MRGPPQTMTLHVGARIGSYEIVSPLGVGGMGEVWRARDLVLGRDVAIKVLRPELTSDSVRVARLKQEARAASSLNHPNVCTIHALGQTDEGRQFIVMEMVEGQTLRDRIRSSQVSTLEALDIAGQVGLALAAAHAAGIVHRDIKPENVIVRSDGVVKVLDFGLAKLSLSEPSSDASTQTVLRTDAGTVMGTTAYMSPEQVRGQQLDARSDLWSLGVMLYELVGGRLPFTGETQSDLIVSILEREPGPPKPDELNVSPELRRVIAKVLRKDREQRYQSAKDLCVDLRTVRGDLASVSSGSRAASLNPGNAASSSFKRAVLAVSIVALVACVATWWVWQKTHAAKSPSFAKQSATSSLRRLNFDSGLQMDVAWSPDGQSVAYASDRAGNFDIWVQPLSGGAAIQLTTSPEHDRQPTWSPDGKTIVFRSERKGGGLFAIPATGGAERQLTTFGSRPKWSPDGNQLLFVRGDFYKRAPQLFTIRIDDPKPQRVLQSFLSTMRGVRAWNWYPDSKRISVLGRQSVTDKQTIYTVALPDETAAVVLRNNQEVGGWAEFEWAASGQTLYVDCGQTEGARGICRLGVDSSSRIVSSQRIAFGAEEEATPVLSRDGKRLASSTGKVLARLWAFVLDESNGIVGDGKPLTDPDAHVAYSALSVDGTALAYIVARDGGDRRELWLANLVTGQHRHLSDDDQFRESPQWSHDGKMLAYRWLQVRPDGRTNQALAIRRTDTQEEQLISVPQLAENVVASPTDWSPDGTAVLASSVLPHSPTISLTLWPLAAAPRAQESMRTLAWNAGTDLWCGTYSPDGRWVAFVAQQPGTSTVYIMPSGGSEADKWVAVTGSNEWADKPRWSADGRLLYFIRTNGAFLNVWARRFDSGKGVPMGEPFQITRFDSPRRQISIDINVTDLNVSAKRLVVPIMEQTGNVWVLDDVDR